MTLSKPLVAVSAEAGVVLQQSASTDEVWLPSRDQLVRVSVSAINRVVAERDYVRIFATQQSFLLRATISRIEQELCADQFIRVHRSMLVAKSDVAALRHAGGGAWVVVHRDGQASPIGRTYHAAVRRALGAPAMGRATTAGKKHLSAVWSR